MTHRDPIDVILSVADIYADIVGGFTDHLDRRYLGELNVRQWSIGMERAVKFCDGGAEDRFFDIDFRAMQADAVGEFVGCTPGSASRWPTSSKHECALGGPRTPRSANRSPTPTLSCSGWTWTGSDHCSTTT